MINAISSMPPTKVRRKHMFNKVLYAGYLDVMQALKRASETTFRYTRTAMIIFGKVMKYSTKIAMAGFMFCFIAPVIVSIIAGDTSIIDSAYSYYTRDLMESISKFISCGTMENANGVLDRIREMEWFREAIEKMRA